MVLSKNLACNNVLSLISFNDVDKHDLVANYQQWQVGIRSFKKALGENDMLTPFLIPEQFKLDDMSLTRVPSTNLIDDFHKIPNKKAQLWQQYLCGYTAPIEVESNTWTVESMQKSMTDLKTLAFHGFENLYPPATGAITVFKTMTNHMVLHNQETIDALHEWIRKFDIRKVNGENVYVACA